jgi:hypothetical protein
MPILLHKYFPPLVSITFIHPSQFSNLYQPISSSTILGSKMGKKVYIKFPFHFGQPLASKLIKLTEKSGFVGPKRHSYIYISPNIIKGRKEYT